MTITIARADAAHLPLADSTIDLIVTSPPYWQLREYADQCTTCEGDAAQRTRGYATRYCPAGHGQTTRNTCHTCGTTTLRTDQAATAQTAAALERACPDCGGTGTASYPWQIGAEPTWQQYLDALIACTAEWARVTKPTGSIVVNLGDTYATRWSSRSQGTSLHTDRDRQDRGGKNTTGVREKSLLGLPERYMLRCIDELGLILRSKVVWHKTNGLPSSAADRFRPSWEVLYHFTLRPQYYHAFDTIRVPHLPQSEQRAARNHHASDHSQPAGRDPQSISEPGGAPLHPLGRMPGDVLTLPTFPLRLPAQLGIRHHAAFPPDLVRPFIEALSPAAICTACGQGRTPVAELTGETGRAGKGTAYAQRSATRADHKDTGMATAMLQIREITGWACDCTPRTKHPRSTRTPTATPGPNYGRDHAARTAATGSPTHRDGWPVRTPATEYHLDGWTPPPTRPGIVLDPFAGTGTTALAADILGRHTIALDGSAAYCHAARWRIRDPGQRAAAAHLPPPPMTRRPAPGQPTMF